jgi:hypothetical protein
MVDSKSKTKEQFPEKEFEDHLKYLVLYLSSGEKLAVYLERKNLPLRKNIILTTTFSREVFS